MLSEIHPQLENVDRRLRREVSARMAASPAASAQLGPLAEEVQRCATSGKRIRTRLVLLSVPEREAAVLTASAFELLHAAFILHDDVIDRDELRRGRPTLHVRSAAAYRAQGWSEATAVHRGYSRSIVAGDLALSTAYAMIHRVPATAESDGGLPVDGTRIVRLFEDAVLATTAGELMDVELSLPPCAPASARPPVTATVDIAALKTAHYTAAAPLAAGAVLAGLPESTGDALHRIGISLGTAFQLTDDLMGTFGRSEVTGKPSWSDLREGKPTPLLAHALASPLADRIGELMAAPAAAPDDGDAQARLEALRELIRESGAVAAVQRSIQELRAEVEGMIADAELPAALEAGLRAMADELIEPRT